MYSDYVSGHMPYLILCYQQQNCNCHIYDTWKEAVFTVSPPPFVTIQLPYRLCPAAHESRMLKQTFSNICSNILDSPQLVFKWIYVLIICTSWICSWRRTVQFSKNTANNSPLEIPYFPHYLSCLRVAVF